MLCSGDDAAKMIAELDANPQLDNIMQSPFFASMACEVYQRQHKLPTCLTDVFLTLVLHLAQQQQLHEYQEGEVPSYTSFSKLPDEVKESILELGSFAFRMLVDKKFTLTEEDLESCKLSDAARRLGLLVACNTAVGDRTATWAFGHIAIQEGVATLFCSRACSRPQDALWLMRALGPLSGHLNTFWAMYAAQLSHSSLCSLIQGILEEQPSGARGESSRAAITDYLFASDSMITDLVEQLCGFLNRTKMEILADKLLGGKVAGSGSLVVLNSMLQRPDTTDMDYMKAMMRLWLSRVPYANRRMLEKAIESVDASAAKVLFDPDSEGISTSNTAADQERLLSDGKCDTGRRQFLLACHCYAESTKRSGCLQPVPALTNWVSMHEAIRFPAVHLSSSDCCAVARVLEDYGPVAVVNLGDCTIGDIGLKELLPGLRMCQHLTNLLLGWNDLTSAHMLEIVDVIRSNAASLLQVDLYRNKNLTPDVTAALGGALAECSKLTYMFMDGSELASVNVATCYHILAHCSKLKWFGFGHGALRSTDLAEISPLFLALQLTGLFLEDNGLTADCSKRLSRIINSQHEWLEGLSLSCNPIGDDGLYEINSSLCSCTCLTVLDLASTSLTSESLPPLTALLSRNANIQELMISLQNDFSEVIPFFADSFAEAVGANGSLRKLCMPARERVHAELQQLLEAKKKAVLELKYI